MRVPGNLPLEAVGARTLDPRVKFAWALGCVVVLGLLPWGSWRAWALLVGALAVALACSRTSVRQVVRRSALALPFLLAALPLAFQPDGVARLQWLVARTWLSVQAVAWAVGSTPFEDVLRVLRWARLPEAFVTIVGLLWRYLFLLGDEAGRMVRARQARTPSRPRAVVRTTGRMAGTLLVRTLERAHRVQLAMVSRGYRAGSPAARAEPLTARSWAALVAGLLVVAASVGLGWAR